LKVCIQRVSEASVTVDEKVVGKIGKGLMVLFGAEKGDEKDWCEKMSHKTCNLRIFEDENEKMSLSVKDIEGELLIISQFTLTANTKKGLRPDFTGAMPPDEANEFYEYFIKLCKDKIGEDKVQKGVFGAYMQVGFVNDGPVTINMEM